MAVDSIGPGNRFNPFKALSKAPPDISRMSTNEMIKTFREAARRSDEKGARVLMEIAKAATKNNRYAISAQIDLLSDPDLKKVASRCAAFAIQKEVENTYRQKIYNYNSFDLLKLPDLFFVLNSGNPLISFEADTALLHIENLHNQYKHDPDEEFSLSSSTSFAELIGDIQYIEVADMSYTECSDEHPELTPGPDEFQTRMKEIKGAMSYENAGNFLKQLRAEVGEGPPYPKLVDLPNLQPIKLLDPSKKDDSPSAPTESRGVETKKPGFFKRIFASLRGSGQEAKPESTEPSRWTRFWQSIGNLFSRKPTSH